MARITEEWRRELLDKTNIADIVGEYAQLTNKSGRWWACCPFHHEKTPSFTVNTDKQFYHCFGCGKGGNVINFVMEMEKLTYPEACQMLADRAGLTMPQTEDKTAYERRRAKKQRTHAMNKQVAHYFYKVLLTPRGQGVRAYLQKRGIGMEQVRSFGLGFAPESWDEVVALLKKQGFSNQEMTEGSLAREKDGRIFSFFRNRLMFPIVNTFGEVIGFGGRVMDDSEPKYLNSSETPAFNKRRNLYNLNRVRRLKNLKNVILVEGYMDVIALTIHGIPNVLATLGTAITIEQAKLIARYTKNVLIAYDGDEAGQKATLRALDVLGEAGLTVRVIAFPDGLDPDDYLKIHKREGFMKLAKAANPGTAYKIALVRRRYNLSDGNQKVAFAKECAQLLKTLKSPLEIEKYVRGLASETGFSESAIYQEIGANKNIKGNDWNNSRKYRNLEVNSSAEGYVLMKIVENPEILQRTNVAPVMDDFEDPVLQKLFSITMNKIKRGFMPTNAEILSELSESEELGRATALLSAEDYEDAEGRQEDDYFISCVAGMKVKKMQREKDALLTAYNREPDSLRKNEILQEINRLTKQLHNKKERLY